MRVSRLRAERNRAAVVRTASKLYRERGFGGAGIAEIMRAAGMTHGAFYGQFNSKEELAAEASAYAFGSALDAWLPSLRGAPGDPIPALADAYLSDEHRVAAGSGCPLAMLAADAARTGSLVQTVFRAGLQDYLDATEASLHKAGWPQQEASRLAMTIWSMLVGAMVLSRAVGDAPLGDQILAAVKSSVAERTPPAAENDR